MIDFNVNTFEAIIFEGTDVTRSYIVNKNHITIFHQESLKIDRVQRRLT